MVLFVFRFYPGGNFVVLYLASSGVNGLTPKTLVPLKKDVSF